MRYGPTAILFACLLLISSPSYALPKPCYSALTHGTYGHLAPCGCWAQGYVFHNYERWFTLHGKRVNLWLADTWRFVFPHTTPHRGAVAVWPGRHVAPVVGDPKIVRGVQYVTVADSWATHDVTTAGKVFVQP